MPLDSDFDFLERRGWAVECQSPFEIRKKDTGDFASGEAALCVLAVEKEEDADERSDVDPRIRCTIKVGLDVDKKKSLDFQTEMTAAEAVNQIMLLEGDVDRDWLGELQSGKAVLSFKDLSGGMSVLTYWCKKS
jgi:hypothetical protein